MSSQFPAKISSRICNHMNEDHADAVLLYAQTFGGLANATAAKIVSIDTQGMNLDTDVNGEIVTVHIQFDHILADAEDAHQTLIAMAKQAQVKLESAIAHSSRNNQKPV